MAKTFIALGSNQGDRLKELQQAASYLKSISTQEEIRLSKIYESDAVGPSDNAYLNAVVCIDYPSKAFKLIHELKEYERSRGRNPNAERWTDRPIDLDIIFLGELHLQSEFLNIPHPEFKNRNFVLCPLLDIEEDIYGPFKLMEIQKLLDTAPENQLKQTAYTWEIT